MIYKFLSYVRKNYKKITYIRIIIKSLKIKKVKQKLKNTDKCFLEIITIRQNNNHLFLK